MTCGGSFNGESCGTIERSGKKHPVEKEYSKAQWSIYSTLRCTDLLVCPLSVSNSFPTAHMDYIWNTVSDSVRSIASTWGITSPASPEPLERCSKKSKGFNGNSVASVSSPDTVRIHLEPLKTTQKGKRNLATREHVEMILSPKGPSSQVEMMTSLLSNMEDYLFISNTKELRMENANLKASIQSVQSNMTAASQRSKPAIHKLLTTLQQHDPANATIRETKDLLNKVDLLSAATSTRTRSRCRSAVPNDQEMNKVLRRTLWQYEQRAVNVRHMLKSITEMLESQASIYFSKAKQRVLRDETHMARVLEFLPLEDIGTASNTYRTWNRVISVRNLLIGGHKTHQQRWQLWTSVCPITPDVCYPALIQRGMLNPPPNYELIKRDIKRTTFADPNEIYATQFNPTFTRLGRCDESEMTRAYQAALERILVAYAVHDPMVGYCQGMTFLAASIFSCSKFQEEISFQMFASMMKQYRMNDIFRDGLSGTLLRFYQMERVMKCSMPDVQVEFERHSIQPMLWATGFVMTIGSNDMTMHPALACRILDTFFAKGWTSVLSILLGFVKIHRSSILGKPMGTILQKLTRLTKNLTSQDDLVQVFAAASSIPLSTAQLEMYEKEFITK